MTSHIRAYWWSPRRTIRGVVGALRESGPLWGTKLLPPHAPFTNYGDELNSLVLPELTGRPVRWAPLGQEDLVGIGTLLDLYLDKGGRGLVFGSGAGVAEQPRELVGSIADRFLAVRGPMTRDALGLDADLPLGDPGLAVRSFGVRPPNARHGRVFVPHFREYASATGRAAMRSYRDAGFTIAHPTIEARRMLDILGSAEYVVSSGMHGMILSHALKTPVSLVSVTEVVPELPGRKYQDYVASVGLPNRLVSWKAPLSPRAPELIEIAKQDVASADRAIDDLVEGLHIAAAPLRTH